MRTTGPLVAMSIAFVAAAWLVVSGWRQPRPKLTSAVEHLRRKPTVVEPASEPRSRHLVETIGALGVRSEFVRRHAASNGALRLIGRPLSVHVGYLIVAATIGLVLPSAMFAVLSLAGIVSLDFVVPAGLSVLAMLSAPLVIHSHAAARADAIRIDLRHQLSGFLDMVTMLLAGNTGHEGALEQAARAGDGLLFRELRRRMREVATTGNSFVVALGLVAADFEFNELEQVASATALSATEGAPVARTLAARCSTLRSTLAADDEAKARVRNDKVAPPLVGMALLFMALIIFPALSL